MDSIENGLQCMPHGYESTPNLKSIHSLWAEIIAMKFGETDRITDAMMEGQGDSHIPSTYWMLNGVDMVQFIIKKQYTNYVGIPSSRNWEICYRKVYWMDSTLRQKETMHFCWFLSEFKLRFYVIKLIVSQ